MPPGTQEAPWLIFIFLNFNFMDKELLKTEEPISIAIEDGEYKKSITDESDVQESEFTEDDILDLLKEMEPYDGLEFHLKLNYDFRFNVVTGRVFWRRKNSGEYSEMGDYDFNTILRDLSGTEFECSKTALIQLLVSSFTPKYDPFIAYLETLPEWDAKTDFIEQMADTVTTTNQSLWRSTFKKWVVALVGSLQDPATVNQTALVFCGKQGVGKTRWINKLIPVELHNYFFSGTINMSNKDSITQLSECMIIDMDELENVGKKSIGDLKSLITREKIRIRRPYGKVAENMPRRASFIGSINSKEFLKDETGSRRFLCFEILEINVSHGLEVNNVYAQALALYKSGFKFWFDQDEIKQIEMNNEQFQKTFFEAELLTKHFKSCNEDKATHFLSSTQIAQILKRREKMSVTHTSVQHIGKALATNKFKRVKRGGRYVWAVQDIKKLVVAGYNGEAAEVMISK